MAGLFDTAPAPALPPAPEVVADEAEGPFDDPLTVAIAPGRIRLRDKAALLLAYVRRCSEIIQETNAIADARREAEQEAGDLHSMPRYQARLEL